MGLFSYKKYVHPVRTARRAAVRSVTPKPIRNVRRAAITVRHPASSLEGAAKASLSRSVSRGRRNGRSRRQTSAASGGGLALVALVVVIALIIAGIHAAVHAVDPPKVVAVGRWVPGHVRSRTGESFFSSASYSQVMVSRVRCRWTRTHVQLHMVVRNKSRYGVKLTVSPQYTLAGHGSHGGSIDGYSDVRISPRANKVVFVDAGQPINTSGQPTITSCGPDLVGIDGW
jgi:hypothetical protein